jgi:hypothetical protein
MKNASNESFGYTPNDSFEAFFIALLTSSTVTSFSNTTVTSVNEPVALT